MTSQKKVVQARTDILSNITTPPVRRKSGFIIKACVDYFLWNYFSPNDSPSKTMKNVFYVI